MNKYVLTTLVLCLINIHCAEEFFPKEDYNDLIPGAVPCRRTVNYHFAKGDTLHAKIYGMWFLGAPLTERDLIASIDAEHQDGKNTNPYSPEQKAHLITLACRYGYLEVVQKILEVNPKALNCVDNTYPPRTPLDEAIAFKNKQLVLLLLERGGKQAAGLEATVDLKDAAAP